MESAALVLTEFQKHNYSSIRVPRQRNVKWKPPSAAMTLKTNFDGTKFSESDQAKIGVVVFEGDFEVIIKALANGDFSLPSIGHIVKDITSMLGLLQSEADPRGGEGGQVPPLSPP
nr:hypothetical protein CFP56_43006 [Quercus suber]